MRIPPVSLALLVVTTTLSACGDKEPPAPRGASGPGPAANSSGAPAAASDHAGAVVDLGAVTLAGHEFSVRRLGDVVPGKEGAFEVALSKAPAGATVETVNVYAWVESADGNQASAPSKGSPEKGRLHVHVTPRADSKDLKRVVLRLRAAGGVDERASLPLDGHGHEHGATPHEGVVAVLNGPDGKPVGHVELKLHDDKGDLELWIARDPSMKEPFDLPLDAAIRVVFADHKDRAVDLRARNKDRNEDEEGTPNARAGRTNYFIFPGDTGGDAAWLMGATFSSIVRLSFTLDGKSYASEEFMLVPHTHADGSTHK